VVFFLWFFFFFFTLGDLEEEAEVVVAADEEDDELANETGAFAGYESSEEDFPSGITRNTVGNVPLEWFAILGRFITSCCV
jgi:hypothetical protein